MKAGERSKLVRGLRQESRRFRLLVIVIGFFLVSLTFVVVSKPEAILFTNLGRRFDQAPPFLVIKEMITSQETTQGHTQETEEYPRVDDDAEENQPKWKAEDEPQHAIALPTVSDGIIDHSSQEEERPDTELLGNGRKAEEKSKQCDDGQNCPEKGKHKITLPTVSSYTINDSTQADSTDTRQEESTIDAEIKLETDPNQLQDTPEQVQFESIKDTEITLQTNLLESEDKPEPTQQGTTSTETGSKPLCDFSNFRTNVCEMEGEIRIHPNSTSIMFMESHDSPREEAWKLKPYPRKGDEFCLSHVTELTVKTSKEAPQCTKHHTVPGLVFSITGYTGNLFHDFTDVLVPLFTTANQFDGEVELVITDMQPWWVIKYRKVLEKLSNYPVVDFNKDNGVHCFKHVIVGLHAYKEFTIDSSKAPNNYTMVDFSRFMRRAHLLQREAITVVGEDPNVKPRLLIISRKRTRAFTNIDEIVAMANALGYEVVVSEAQVASDVSQFASIVNSCDVMMGVHGAGLTNSVFLPPNATLIQIVPWGGLDWICRLDFGDPAAAMGLRYKQYSIAVDESSLTKQYPRDHEIFKNPYAFHKRGFDFIRRTFMDNQNVTLDMKRFRSVLLEALDHLNP